MAIVIAEIKGGGIKGICGLDQLDWGNGGKIYECWKLQPCCGKDVKSVCTCLITWYFCSSCAIAKLYSHSLDQDCGILNHCLFACCCPYCTAVFLRYNLRKKNGVPGNMIGDCVCLYFCNACSVCQELRSVPAAAWQIFPVPPIKPKVDPIKFIRMV